MSTADIAVVGAGMIGSAAALALADRGFSTVLIGPDEPVDRASHEGVFGSHYDEGRITRVLDPDPLWARLARASIARYADIEELSGIAFHSPVGCLRVARSDAQALASCREVAVALDLLIDTLDAAEVARRWPAIRLPEGLVALWEEGPAGHINPRRLVAALRKAAGQHGARRLAETVAGMGLNGDAVALQLASGARVSAARVLVATGAFALEPALLPAVPDMTPLGRTIVLFRTDQSPFDAGDLPSFMAALRPEDDAYSLYAVPPVPYPGGGIWLKAGAGIEPNALLPTEVDPRPARRWFQGPGSETEVAAVREMALSVFPGLENARWRTDTCAIAETPTNRPFIGRVPGTAVGIALGCNGYAAKSCIAIGAMAARMISDDAWAGSAEAGEVAPKWRAA